MREWNGSVAFITGGGQGIGLGIARALASRGVSLALADIDDAALSSSREELSAVTNVATYHLDVRDREAYARVADEAEAALGPVNLLFNNAGIAPYSSIARMDYAKWDLAIGINLMGVVNGCQTFLPRMIERGTAGHVVNTASGAGLIANQNVLYATTKFAVVGLSESLRLAASKHGIDVSVLCPAAVDTNILDNTVKVGEGASVTQRAGQQETKDFLSAGVPINDVGEMVIAGMEANAVWIYTDDTMRPYVKMRTEWLLEAMPGPAVTEAA